MCTVFEQVIYFGITVNKFSVRIEKMVSTHYYFDRLRCNIRPHCGSLLHVPYNVLYVLDKNHSLGHQ